MPKRTSHAVITARFMLLCAPVGIIFGLLLLPFIIPILLGFFGILIVFWVLSAVFTNTVVKIADPKGYQEFKKAGGNPFFDSLGAPLNFDSEQVRVQNDNPQPRQYQNIQSQVQPPQPQPPQPQTQSPKQRKLWNGQNVGRT